MVAAKMKANKRTRESDVLSLKFELKSLDIATGHFEGYMAIFSVVDRVNDICEPGCFTETLAAWKDRGIWPRVHWKHWQLLGHVTNMQEDDRGILATGQLWLNDKDVWYVAEDIAAAMPNVFMSFAYYAEDYEVIDGVRHIKKLTLLDDVTLTENPVNTQAELLEIKSQDGAVVDTVPTKRATESILRDAGYSRSSAKILLAGGFDSLREVKDRTAGELVPKLKEILGTLQAINNPG